MPSIASLKKAQTDPTLRESGVWAEFSIADDVEPLRLKLRAASSTKVRAWELKRFRAQRSYYLGDRVPPIEVIDQNEVDKMAEAIVVDWNVTENGHPVPCTTEQIRIVMTDLPDTRRAALAECAKVEQYRLAGVEGIAKNSEQPSALSSGTGATAA